MGIPEERPNTESGWCTIVNAETVREAGASFPWFRFNYLTVVQSNSAEVLVSFFSAENPGCSAHTLLWGDAC